VVGDKPVAMTLDPPQTYKHTHCPGIENSPAVTSRRTFIE